MKRLLVPLLNPTPPRVGTEAGNVHEVLIAMAENSAPILTRLVGGS